jgi:flagellar biosynthetic protein FlhB
MSGEETGQNKTEEATPFKLRKARERGQVARGLDLGFAGSLVTIALVALVAGERFAAMLAQLLRYSFTAGISTAADPQQALDLVGMTYWAAFRPLVILGAVLIVVLVSLELIQLRGFMFSTQPLKPDFQRLNPATGIKRLFSARMLKETLKSLVKFAAYGAAAWFVIVTALETLAPRIADARRLAEALQAGTWQVLTAFVALAAAIAIIDQLIARGEYRKQMRMTRRELTRENREREGEPRLKQRRRDLHQQMRQQAEGLGRIDGSDLVVINPEHYAVALRYDPKTMKAPEVRAKGRDHFAQLMKRKAFLLGIPVMPHPGLARALYADCKPGRPIAPDHYRDVAQLYRALSRSSSALQLAQVS